MIAHVRKRRAVVGAVLGVARERHGGKDRQMTLLCTFGQRRIQRVFDESPCRRLPLLRVRTQVRKFCDRTEKRTLTPDRAGKPQRQTDLREQPKGLLLTEMTYKTILGILF